MKQTSVALVALLAACSSPPRATEPSATAAPLKAKTPEAAARAYLDEKAREYGLTPSTLRLVHVHDTGRGGLIAVFRAQQQGVDLVERDVKVLLKRDLTPMALVTRPVPPSTRLPFVLDADGAIAAARLELPGDALVRKARARRVYFPTEERLLPAFSVELLRDDDGFNVVIDAFSGRALRTRSLLAGANVTWRVFADTTGAKTPWDGPLADFTPHPTGLPDALQPTWAQPQLVTIDGFNAPQDPWLAAGATETRGNNVDVYTDDGAPAGFSAGDVRAVLTGPATFDYGFDSAQEPIANLTQRRAVVTSTFYVTNWLHDDWYGSGFDEAAGNAQASNYGRGGVEGDLMTVQVQYAPTTQRNNANAMTPADGESPRLRFYLFDPVEEGALVVSGEPSGVQSLLWGSANFGPQTFDVTGPLTLVNDGSATPTLACNPIINNVAGSIALIDRGTCPFTDKVQHAQNAGAIGVIIINNQAGPPNTMTGSTAPTIGVLSTSNTEGAALKSWLQAGPLTATLQRFFTPLRDSALDNTIVAHEWGHYLHHRLTESNSAMTDAQSEGWGDFLALHLTLRPGDALDGVYPCAQYATSNAYFGIRRVPYSTDFTKNALTFRHVTDGVALPSVPTWNNGVPNSEVHNAGEVWASAVFEAYVALQRRATGATPAYSFADARRRMADYVVAGMKLSPADATFTEMRDALLLAAFAADPDDAVTMAEAFARRGLGSCAVSPPRFSSDFLGAVESFAVKPDPKVAIVGFFDSTHSCDLDGIIDSGEAGFVRVRVSNRGVTALNGATLTLGGALAGLTFPGGATVSVPTLAPFAEVELDVAVRLSTAVSGAAVLDLTATLAHAGACTPSTVATRWAWSNVDELAAASATDTVEPSQTSWTLTTLFDGGAEATEMWRREAIDAGQTVWHADAVAEISASALESPALLAGDAGLVLTFNHRYRFEQSDNTNWDGALLEVQSDGGTWQPVDLATYGGTLTAQADNPLANRMAFVGESPGWPAFTTQSVTFGPEFAGKTVRVRFVVGSDPAVTEYGWELDALSITGALNTPFFALAPEGAACAPPPPTADAQTLTTAEDTLSPVTLSGHTAEGALSFTVTTPPAHGALTGTPPALTYAPAADFHGSDSFAFTVSDTFGGTSAAALVSITVTPENDPPVATSGSATVQSGGSVAVTLAGLDVDGDALTYSVASTPAHGAVTGTPPVVTYTPVAGFVGADSFTFTAMDGLATSAPATISVTVTPAPVDAGAPTDAGSLSDAGAPGDAGTGSDAGTDDAGTDDAGTDDAGTDDAGTSSDAGISSDAGTNSNSDAGVSQADGGMQSSDAGLPSADGGIGDADTPKGCGCTSGFELLPVALLLLFRRSRALSAVKGEPRVGAQVARVAAHPTTDDDAGTSASAWTTVNRLMRR